MTSETKSLNLLRWFAFLPAALLAYAVAQFVFGGVVKLALAGLGDADNTVRAIVYTVTFLFGPLALIPAGSIVAPMAQKKVALWLFWIYAVRITIVSLFRAPQPDDDVSAPIFLVTGLVGAICGLLIALFWIKSRTAKATPQVDGPQNPWAGERKREDSSE